MLYAEFKGKTTWASEFDQGLADTNTCKDGLEHYPLCPECDGRVTHHSKSSDGRAAHFAHCSSGGGGGGADCAGARVGEREEHKAMKDIAASAVAFALSGVEVAAVDLEHKLTAAHSAKQHRRADCLIEFEHRDAQLGEGLIIEVQYENTSKDKTATTLDYLQADNDYSILWLWEKDFHTGAGLPKDWNCKLVHDQTVRDRVRRQMWPINNPASIWDPERTYEIGLAVEGLSTVWRSRNPDHADTAELINEVAESSETSPPDATVAGTAIDGLAQQYKESKDWEDLFHGVGWTEVLIQEVRDGLGLPDATVPASFVNPEAIDELAQQYKESKDWEELFHGIGWSEVLIQEVRDGLGLPNATIPASFTNLPRLEPTKLRERCPECDHRHDLTPPADGEVCRGKTCRRCEEWFTVFDKREKA
jgi:hypothetical protein